MYWEDSEISEKVLVTGATGFVGSALVRKLLQQGETVRIIVRDDSNTSNIDGLHIERVKGDILDKGSIKRALVGCSSLYHVAGLYRSWMHDYGMLYRVNVVGTRNVLEAALQAGLQKVVHTGSIAALGIRDDGRPSDENTPFNLSHLKLPYEVSKYESEQAAFELFRKGLPVVVVRPALVMGEGDVYPTPSGKLVLDILRGTVPSYFDGGIDVVDVADVAAGHIRAMQMGQEGESYNLGCQGNFTTMKELFVLIAQCGGVRPPGIRVPVFMALAWAYMLTAVADHITHREPVATPANIRALALKKQVDFSRARTELNIPQTPLQTIVEKTIAWYRSKKYV